ncbi:hypothetical protein BM221_001584 [Beauveria bassiana]|uniref:Uncharacterized protein n=1 Tax=Beauveria bassiana TaxID=176275 RepID=A0A2N6NW51_BEABA|nr:hypothetical protein BM221_001584 [Beauveria bassiana]
MATVHVVPGLVAKRKAIEKERVKDGLRRWIAAKWRGEVQEREEMVRHHDEQCWGFSVLLNALYAHLGADSWPTNEGLKRRVIMGTRICGIMPE